MGRGEGGEGKVGQFTKKRNSCSANTAEKKENQTSAFYLPGRCGGLIFSALDSGAQKEGLGEIEKKKERAEEKERLQLHYKSPNWFNFLQSLAAAQFRLVNQTIGGVGRHSVLLLGDQHGHVIESFSRF